MCCVCMPVPMCVCSMHTHVNVSMHLMQVCTGTVYMHVCRHVHACTCSLCRCQSTWKCVCDCMWVTYVYVHTLYARCPVRPCPCSVAHSLAGGEGSLVHAVRQVVGGPWCLCLPQRNSLNVSVCETLASKSDAQTWSSPSKSLPSLWPRARLPKRLLNE